MISANSNLRCFQSCYSNTATNSTPRMASGARTRDRPAVPPRIQGLISVGAHALGTLQQPVFGAQCRSRLARVARCNSAKDPDHIHLRSGPVLKSRGTAGVVGRSRVSPTGWRVVAGASVPQGWWTQSPLARELCLHTPPTGHERSAGRVNMMAQLGVHSRARIAA